MLEMGMFGLRNLITVRYSNGQIDKIPRPLLNTMIETHKIIGFKRKKSWVVVDKDAVRGTDHGYYNGRERRRH